MGNSIVNSDINFFVEHIPFLAQLRGNSILITGATGLIGSTLIKCLLAANDKLDANIKIIAMARNEEKAKSIFGNSPIQWVFQDMAQPLFSVGFIVDYIVHCANSTSSKFYVENPVENINTSYIGTNNLLSFAKENHIKSMVYLSSLESYGTVEDDGEITEDMMGYITPTDVRSSYSLGKRATECLCHCYAKEYGVPVKMARLTQTFGAGVSLADNRVFAQFAKSIIKGENIVMHTKGESAKPYCYTIDCLFAILYILMNGKDGEAYNVANSDTYISIYEMAKFLSDRFNPDCKVVIELHDDMGYAPVTHLNLNTDKLKKLGWKPYYDLDRMYSQLISYYKTVM